MRGTSNSPPARGRQPPSAARAVQFPEHHDAHTPGSREWRVQVRLAPRHSLRSVFFDECSLSEATYPTLFEGVDIVPSGLDLSRVEYERPIGAENAIAAAIAEEVADAGGRSPYDVTLIDAAPSLGLVTVAALTAGDEALVPVKVGVLDMKAMASLDRTIRSVQRKTNPKLKVGAVFLTAWNKSDFARQLATKVKFPRDPGHDPVMPRGLVPAGDAGAFRGV
ncbi:AAA family ATPase [Streptomyces sp. NBC_00846]|uniref:ParA family protein n=1 Tax=Streptomyces sp. NBC_00846 TaxID=2975849 RepID=UPI003866EE6E|nr:AAA family ATPase [Streptomyces sp. NBC_00846]